MNIIRVEKQNGQLVVDSRLIATRLGVSHKSFSETIRKHLSSIESAFGHLPFKTETVINSVGAKNKARFYFLNEDQSLFLMTLSRNTEQVIQCKLDLVKGFSHAKKILQDKQPKLPQTYLEALEALVASEKEKEQLKLQAAADKPKVEFANAIAASKNSLTFLEYAKSINQGRNKLMRLLREMNILMKNSTLPYQKYIDAGYFEVSQEIDDRGKTIPFALVTNKGQLWLYGKIRSRIALQQAVIKNIVEGVQQTLF